MLLVTLEIVPFGEWADKYQIKQIYIGNVGGNSVKANYYVWFDKDPTDKTQPRPAHDIEIKGYKRVKGAQELVRQILNKFYAKSYKKEKTRYKKSSRTKI